MILKLDGSQNISWFFVLSKSELKMFFFVFDLFFNRSYYSLLNFGGLQLYNSEALPFTYHQFVIIELVYKLYNSVSVCFCVSPWIFIWIYNCPSCRRRESNHWFLDCKASAVRFEDAFEFFIIIYIHLKEIYRFKMDIESQKASPMYEMDGTRLPSDPWPFWTCVNTSSK